MHCMLAPSNCNILAKHVKFLISSSSKWFFITLNENVTPNYIKNKKSQIKKWENYTHAIQQYSQQKNLWEIGGNISQLSHWFINQ